jgi:hypothetical protein
VWCVAHSAVDLTNRRNPSIDHLGRPTDRIRMEWNGTAPHGTNHSRVESMSVAYCRNGSATNIEPSFKTQNKLCYVTSYRRRFLILCCACVPTYLPTYLPTYQRIYWSAHGVAA